MQLQKKQKPLLLPRKRLQKLIKQLLNQKKKLRM